MAEFDRPGADVPSEYTEVKPSTDGGLGGPGAFSGYVGETLMTPGASLATGRGEVYTGEPTGKGRIGLGGDAAVRTDFTEMRPASEVAADEGQPITGETRAAGAPSLGVLSAVKALKNRLNGGSLLPHSETTETAAPNGRVEGDGGIPPSAFTETVVAVAPETTFDTRAQHDAGTEQAEAEAGLPDDAAGPYDVPSTAMPLAEVPLVSEVPDGKIPEVPEVPPESTVPPEATGQPEYDATAPEADDMPPPTEGAEGTGYPEQRYKHDAQTTSGQQETAN